MRYQAYRVNDETDDWFVLFYDLDDNGVTYTECTRFGGPNSRKRACEYAAMMNANLADMAVVFEQAELAIVNAAQHLELLEMKKKMVSAEFDSSHPASCDVQLAMLRHDKACDLIHQLYKNGWQITRTSR